MVNALGIISYTGAEVFVKGLSKYRPVAAFAYVGRYRLVDIPISNMTNSGLQNIHVYTNQNPKVLFDHIGSARHYNINNKHGHVSIIPVDYMLNAPEFISDMTTYYNNLDEIEDNPNDYVIIAPANWVYKVNFEDVLENHIESRADISILYHHFDNISPDGLDPLTGETVSFKNKQNLLNANALIREDGKVTGLKRYLGETNEFDASLDTYVMSKAMFIQLIKESYAYTPMFWLRDYVSYKLSQGTMTCNPIEYSSPVFPIFNLRGYFEANMEMLKEQNMAFFNDANWPIYTRTNDSSPTIYLGKGTAQKALISNGCEISGTVSDSILGRNVKVGEGAVVSGCLVLPGAEIGPGVMLTDCLVDKDAKVMHSPEVTGYNEEPYYIARRREM